jgi:hypothetical protein
MKLPDKVKKALLTPFGAQCYEYLLELIDEYRIEDAIDPDSSLSVAYEIATNGWPHYLRFDLRFANDSWLRLQGNVTEEGDELNLFIGNGPPFSLTYTRCLPGEKDEADQFVRSLFREWLTGQIRLEVECVGGFPYKRALLWNDDVLAESRSWLYPWWMKKSTRVYRCRAGGA